MLKEAGYATGCFGKWHPGDQPQFLPTRHRFDAYFGISYSNDMWPLHSNAGRWESGVCPLAVPRGEEVVDPVEDMDDPAQLCQRFDLGNAKNCQAVGKAEDPQYLVPNKGGCFSRGGCAAGEGIADGRSLARLQKQLCLPKVDTDRLLATWQTKGISNIEQGISNDKDRQNTDQHW